MDSNLQISAEADLAPLERLGQVWLETKPTWADQWEEDVRLIPQGCTRLAGSQGAGELTFSYRYGPLESPHWMVGPVHLPKMPTLRGHWIRVRTHVGAADVTLWTGRITEPVEQIHGDQVAGVKGPAASGEQVWRALGPQALLERCKISRSLWSFVDGAKFTAQYLPWVPDFNGRRGEKGVLGNRSDEICTMDGWEAGIYVFGGHSLWRASDIVRYVLRMVSDFDPTGPRWVLTSEALLRDYNPHIAGRDVMSAAEIIATAISLDRGLDWAISEHGNGFAITPFVITGRAGIAVGGQPLPPNEREEHINISEDRRMAFEVEYSQRERYDKIRVLGDRVVSVFSVGGRADNLAGQLVPNWTQAAQAQYVAGLEDGTAEDNDRYRHGDIFAAVFQEFRVQSDFNFNFDDGHANIVFRPDGSADPGPTQFQRFLVGTLPRLPLMPYVDYRTNPPVSSRPAWMQPDYLPLLVFAWDADEHKWLCVNTLAADGLRPNVGVHALDNEMGVRLASHPRHLFARGAWNDAGPSKFDPDTQGGFYSGALILTLAIETDHRVSMEIAVPPDVAAGDGSVKEVLVGATSDSGESSVELWWLSRNTVLGVNEAGELLRAPPRGYAVRDDRLRLEELARGLVARYLYERVRASLTIRGSIEPWQGHIGALLVAEGEQGELVDVQSPITAVQWDFTQRTTRLLCGHAER